MLNGNISCQQISDVSSAYRKDIWKSLFHMSLRYAELTSEICWRVWGTPANFNGFRVFASLYCTDVAQRRSTKLCTMFGRLLHWYTVYVFWGILPAAKFTLRATLAFSKLAALPHGTRALASAKVCGVVQGMELRNFRRGRYIHSVERPSRWASAHIPVVHFFVVKSVKFVFFYFHYLLRLLVSYSGE